MTVAEKMPSRLLPRVLWRVLPSTIVALLGIWLYASHVVTGTVSAELEKALEREAIQAAKAAGARLSGAIDALESLARNDLIVNGLIDMEDRANYLPVFFQSLQLPGTSGGRVTLADYRDAPWLDRVLSGERVTRFGTYGLVSAVPVMWLGQAEGLVVMEQSPAELGELLKLLSVSHVVEIRLDNGEAPLYRAAPGDGFEAIDTMPPQVNNWVSAEARVPGFPSLTVVVKERAEIAFASAARLDRLMLIAIAMSIIAITGGIIATAYYTTDPLRRFVYDIEKIGRSETLGHRVHPFGSAEFHSLSDSLNHMLENLERTTTSRDYFNTVLNSLSEILLITDLDGRIGLANQAATRITGWSVEALCARSIGDVLRGGVTTRQPEDTEAAPGDETAMPPEGHLIVKDGNEIPVQVSVARMAETDGMEPRLIYVLSDITERKQAEWQLSELARFDTLTGLANRSLFHQRLTEALANAKRNGHQVGLLLLDLDRFKEINDTLGHPAGDALLREVATRLKKTTRETDTVARLGGDEFAVIATNLKALDGVATIATKLIDAVAPAFHLDGQEVRTSTSIGVSISPPEMNDPDVMFTHADFALYRAKAAGRGVWRYFDEEMNAQRSTRKALEADLERAMTENQLTLFYQPKVDAVSGALTGVEALIRWQHPERGMVPPNEFIPIAESVGRIVELGEWVIHEACAQHVAWREAGLPPIAISVNLSAVQFKNGGLVDSIQRATAKHGIDPAHLELEITESTIIHNLDDVVRQLEALNGLGYRIYIDDFGTGYSSLAYLQRFPIDGLKIDRSFISNMTENPDDATITNAIVSLARSLGVGVVAEGVETHEQLALLRRQGCTEVQGYLFKPPVPADAFVSWLQTRGAPSPDLSLEGVELA